MNWKFVNLSAEQIHSETRKLMLVNALRSIGQGMLVVGLTLYLSALGWSTTAIGSVLTAGGLLGVALTPVIGIYSDRFGRKPFMLFFEALNAGCALVGFLSTNFILLFTSITLSGFGKADAGSPSPSAPAEQAWLASFIALEYRGKIYSLNNALSFFGMALGAILAGSSVLWKTYIPGSSSFRWIFLFIFLIYLITTSILLTVRGGGPVRQEKKELDGNLERNLSHEENTAILKLAAVNILNGIAVGLTGPMMSYWFAVKFGASSAQIGGTLAITFFATGVTSLFQAKLSSKHGTIRSIVLIRFLASILLLLMPILSNYVLVSVLYIIRTALNRGTQGAQQALSVSLTRDRRRGFASSIHVLSMRIPTAVGPYISGYFFGLGTFALPFYIASGLQLSFAYLYGKIFRTYDVRMKSQASSG